MTDTLAIDFGTSNTAAAVLEQGRPRLLELEDGQDTLPTALFLDFARRETLFGHAAVAALIDGREGRFMRALKSVLGTPLMREKRQFLNERTTLVDVVGRFLAEVKARAEADCGRAFPHALSGRPVRFHSTDETRNVRALEDLRAAYAAAGFESVRFLPEPEAAARAAAVGEGLGLVVDIGGGTSDFTAFERDGGAIRVLASHGERIGGTDFDKALSLAHVMPLLGRGSEIRAEMGDRRHPAPAALFNDLAAWETIPFLYTAETRRNVARMARLAVDAPAFARLATVLEMELGHDIAFAVEAGKIAANGAGGVGDVPLSVIEPGLSARIEGEALSAVLTPYAERIGEAALETLARAGRRPEDVGRVVFVGGSSLLAAVEAAVATRLPAARLERSNAFTAIADGLAIATGEAG